MVVTLEISLHRGCPLSMERQPSSFSLFPITCQWKHFWEGFTLNAAERHFQTNTDFHRHVFARYGVYICMLKACLSKGPFTPKRHVHAKTRLLDVAFLLSVEPKMPHLDSAPSHAHARLLWHEAGLNEIVSHCAQNGTPPPTKDGARSWH